MTPECLHRFCYMHQMRCIQGIEMLYYLLIVYFHVIPVGSEGIRTYHTDVPSFSQHIHIRDQGRIQYRIEIFHEEILIYLDPVLQLHVPVVVVRIHESIHQRLVVESIVRPELLVFKAVLLSHPPKRPHSKEDHIPHIENIKTHESSPPSASTNAASFSMLSEEM